MKEKKSFQKTIEPIVFWPAFIIMIGVTMIGVFNYNTLLSKLFTVYRWATASFGWTYVLVTVVNLLICLILLVHPVFR